MASSVVAVVPARFDSTRFPGKPLADILGEPMVVRVARSALKATRIDRVIVATDDDRIRQAVDAAGIECRMTRGDHASGMDRVAEVAAQLENISLIVNVQGDEPMLDPADLDALVQETLDSKAAMGTLARAISDPLDFQDPHVVKIVRSRSGRALYFSRAPIPFGEASPPALVHVGLYAYRPDTLTRLASASPTELELRERLEQLRALEHDIDIHVAIARSSAPSIAVDVPEDLQRVIDLLKRTTPEEFSNATA